MSHKKLLRSVIGIILTFPFLTGCGQPATPFNTTATPTRMLPATSTPTIELTSTPPVHRIGVRLVDGMSEFYDRINGEKFIPRGNNYIRLAPQQSISGEMMVYHSTFNVDYYDPAQAEEALRKMHTDGYNVVRVFVQGNCRARCIGDPAGRLSADYMANVADFLRKAKAYDIYVILTTDSEPGTPYYVGLLDTTWSEDFGGNNSIYLRGGGILAGKEFWQDLIEALLDQDAPLDAIFAYALRNELFFESNLPPLNRSSGSVSTANAKSYDMASKEEQQRMMDENLVLWIDEIRSAIQERDPTALVTVGFFWPQKPHPARLGDPRVIETRPAIWESSADFIDLHLYPGGDLSLPQYVDNFGMAGMEEKPIIMGEFGAARSSYPSVEKTAQVLHDWQVESCQHGFDGWLLWTWDSEEQTDFYNGLAGEGQINQVLAPVNRPDPCLAGAFDLFEHNLALKMPAQASRSLPVQSPSAAVDGNMNAIWGAGDFAPQWIQIDLGQPTQIGSIRLVAAQSPAGETLHQLWVGSTPDKLSLLHSFEGYTADKQVLEFQTEKPLENIRFVQVLTKKSPSWVAWAEIEILAP